MLHSVRYVIVCRLVLYVGRPHRDKLAENSATHVSVRCICLHGAKQTILSDLEIQTQWNKFYGTEMPAPFLSIVSNIKVHLGHPRTIRKTRAMTEISSLGKVCSLG